MRRILKYFKPFSVSLIIAVILLFVQADADLTLPDYMADIVNIGIQQGGIDSPLPLAMSLETFEQIKLLTNLKEQSIVQSHYTLIKNGSEDFVLKYPILKDEDIYLLKTVDDKTRTTLETIFTRVSGGDKASRQSAVRFVLTEYKQLGMNTENIQRNYILHIGSRMLLIALISAAATIAVGLIAARIAAGLARDLRHELYQHVMHFSGAEFNRFSTASLITRTTNDITQIQSVTIMLVRMMFFAPIIGVGAVIRALDKNASMWWILMLAVLLLLGMITITFVIAIPKYKLIQKLIDRINLIARENLIGMMVVRAFGREKYEEKRFAGANKDLTETNLFVNRVFVITMPFMMLIMNGASMLIIWVGAHQVAQAQMQVGDMMAFMQYATQVVFAFMMLSMLFIMFPRADVSANRIADVLDTPITILNPENPKHFPTVFQPTVEFRRVTTRYPDAEDDVLNDISFNITAGHTVGIMGTTGSGKSTIVDLIPRFFDVTGGQILLSGIDIREISLDELRNRIAYIPQTSSLFTGTIESNLQFANEEADKKQLHQALVSAQAEDFISSRPEGIQTEVSQGGINFSGGQKQRLTIARALVKKAQIYIFDDSFSALDYKTDALLRRALLKELGECTVFIVSQRVSTIKNADKILVLDQGQLIDEGTHLELMQSCKIYREIALSQLKQDALT